ALGLPQPRLVDAGDSTLERRRRRLDDRERIAVAEQVEKSLHVRSRPARLLGLGVVVGKRGVHDHFGHHEPSSSRAISASTSSSTFQLGSSSCVTIIVVTGGPLPKSSRCARPTSSAYVVSV